MKLKCIAAKSYRTHPRATEGWYPDKRLTLNKIYEGTPLGDSFMVFDDTNKWNQHFLSCFVPVTGEDFAKIQHVANIKQNIAKKKTTRKKKMRNPHEINPPVTIVND